MADEKQYRRGTAAQVDVFTGAAGEITIDTDTHVLRIHDGATAGGHKLPAIAGGANANFTTMPQVGGSPIVESDSNSNGAYTRWADGTQISSNDDIRLDTLQHTSLMDGTTTYPAAFTAAPTFSGIGFRTATALLTGCAQVTRENVKNIHVSSITATTCNFRMYQDSGTNAFQAADDTPISCVFHGFWK